MPAKRKYANEITSYSPHRVRRQPLWHTAGLAAYLDWTQLLAYLCSRPVWPIYAVVHVCSRAPARACAGRRRGRRRFVTNSPAQPAVAAATGSAHLRASRRDLYLSLVALLCRSQTCIQPLYDLSIYANYCDGFCSNVHMCLIFIIRSDPCRRSGN